MIFTSIFLFAALYDWDFVIASIEVDLRSLVIDGKIPSWSYQFCSGSSRIADPQSYGASPLIILPVLFGSVIGSKLMLLFASVVGIFYLKKIIDIIDVEKIIKAPYLLILSFLCGNYFLFHFSEGHLSFSSTFFAFPLFYLCLKTVFNQKIENKELLLNTIYLFLIFSGGFYQPLIYFLLPLSIIFLIYLLFTFKKLEYKKNILKLLASSTIAIIFSLYRILPVLDYQKEYPRTLKVEEWNNLFDQFMFFITPIYNKRFFIPFRVPYYSAGEDSFFGGITIAFFLLLFFYTKRIKIYFKDLTNLKKFSIISISMGLLLASGNKYPFMPFAILTKQFSGAIRVASRFNFLTYLGIFLLMIDLLRSQILSPAVKKGISVIIFLTTLTCFFQHYTYSQVLASINYFMYISKISGNYENKMQYVFMSKPADNIKSYMFPPVMFGFSVPNCYQPMNRATFLTGPMFRRDVPEFEWHFMQTENEDQTSECLKNSYFTQSTIHIDSSCRPKSRIHLNFINDEHIRKFKISTTSKGYYLP